MPAPAAFGTTFFYGIKTAQLAGLVVHSFGYSSESRLKTELMDENGKLVGLRFDDKMEKLSITAMVTAASIPVENTVITFAAVSGETTGAGIASKKYRIASVKLDGTHNEKAKVTLECEANEYITLP